MNTNEGLILGIILLSCVVVSFIFSSIYLNQEKEEAPTYDLKPVFLKLFPIDGENEIKGISWGAVDGYGRKHFEENFGKPLSEEELKERNLNERGTKE